MARSEGKGPEPRRNDRPRSAGAAIARIIALLRRELWSMLAVIGTALAGVMLAVLGPKVLGSATDVIFAGFFGRSLPSGMTQAEAVAHLREHGDDIRADMAAVMTLTPGEGIDFTALIGLLWLAVGIYVASMLFQWLQGLLLNRVVQKTAYRLRDQVERKIHRVPLGYFDGMRRGELLSRVTNDMDNLAQTMQQVISQLLTSLLTIIGVLVMMLVISPLLALIALISVPLIALVTRAIVRRSRPLFVAQWGRTGELNAQVEEAYSAHDIVQAFDRQDAVAEEFEQVNEEVYRASFRAQVVSGFVQPVTMFISNLSYVGVAIFGGLMVAGGTLRIGDVQAFIQYTRQFAQPLGQIASMVNLVQSGAASAERIFDFLDADEQDPDPEAPVSPERGANGAELVFDGVGFRYTPDEPLLDDLDLVVPAGAMVAIVGPTGSGKSTLVNLLMRFYEPTAGGIRYNGVDIAEMSRDDLRSRTGMVLQDTWLTEGSVWDNIAYGNPHASDHDVRAAAAAAHIDGLVQTIPDAGPDADGDGATPIAGSENFSAGERQLITIARAFVAQPEMLILDEATSSVDTRTEVLVQDAMRRLRAGRTSFVIAHRLSTIRDADLILVLDDGTIVEQGSHDELMSARGAYAELYATQFDGRSDED